MKKKKQQDKKCICACHGNEWNSMRKHAPVIHDRKYCDNINGSVPSQPTEDVEVLEYTGYEMVKPSYAQPSPLTMEERAPEEKPIMYSEIDNILKEAMQHAYKVGQKNGEKYDFSYSQKIKAFISYAVSQALKEERSEVNEAIKNLSQIINTNHITSDMVTTATALMEAKRQEDMSKYIRSLEDEIVKLKGLLS